MLHTGNSADRAEGNVGAGTKVLITPEIRSEPYRDILVDGKKELKRSLLDSALHLWSIAPAFCPFPSSGQPIPAPRCLPYSNRSKTNLATVNASGWTPLSVVVVGSYNWVYAWPGIWLRYSLLKRCPRVSARNIPQSLIPERMEWYSLAFQPSTYLFPDPSLLL